MGKRQSKHDKDIKTNVSAAVADALAEFQTLGEEMRDWYDGMPENLQDGERGSAISEAADNLEAIEAEIDVPAVVAELPVQYQERQQKTGRAARRNYAVTLLSAAIDQMQQWVDDDDNSEHEEREAVETCIESAQEALDNAEGVEFPGMFG